MIQAIMQTILLLTILLGSGVVAEWPCPLASDLAPCVCSTDSSSLFLFLDCSDATSTQELQDAFTGTHFPFTDFKSLTINPYADPHSGLDTLPAGVFGPVAFEEITIMNTLIHTIEEDALANSHTTVTKLDLTNNKIVIFPFETLDLFIVLRELNMANNKLAVLPDIVSTSLKTIDLSVNPGLPLSQTTFTGATNLENLHLRNMGLGISSGGDTETVIPDNVFNQLSYLEVVDLSGNVIEGQLIENFMNPPLKTILMLDLNYNRITDIHPTAITGLEGSAHVRLSNNQITVLESDNWAHLLDQVTTDDAIDLRENPLTCGCDVFWLVVNNDLMRKIHSDTKCEALNNLHDLDIEWFIQHCPDGP